MDEITKAYLETNEINVQAHLNKQFIALMERVDRVEEKVFPDKKDVFTLNQQIIALEYFGIIQIFRELDLSQIKKAELLGLLIKRDTDSVKKALNKLSNAEDEQLKTAHNYKQVSEKFAELGLEEAAKSMELKRQEVENRK
jgi:hypothetical protein